MRFVETYRSVVAPADCDQLGHMNVSKYFAACGDGVLTFQTALGLSPSDLRDGRRLSFAVVRAESDFYSELVAGDVIYLQTGLEEIGGKSAVFRQQLLRAEDDVVVFATSMRCVLLDLKNRRAVEIPFAVRERAQEFLSGASD